MARIKDITFESGSLTGTNGADSTTGTAVAIDGTSAIKGTYTAKITASASTGYVVENWTATDSVYISLYVKIASGPTTAAVICDLRDSGGGIYRIRADADELWLADGGNTQIGNRFTYSVDTSYRLGLRYTKGTGADAIVEFFAVAGDDPFGTAIASTSAGTATVQADRVRIGATNSQTSTFFIDNIRIDDASMPTDDVAGGTTYDQSINVSVNNVVSTSKEVNKPLSFTAVSVSSIVKQSSFTISVSVSNTVLTIKQAIKPLSVIANVIVPDIVKEINKSIDAVASSTLSILKAVTITLDFTTAANVVINYGLLFYKTIDIVVGTTATVVKQINKSISVVSTIVSVMERALTAFSAASSAAFGRNIAAVSISRANEQTQAMANTDSNTISIDTNDDTTI